MDKKISWNDDKLGREKVANHLTTYILNAYSNDQFDEASVININSPWGFGKTFFLKNWAIDLENDGHPVVYFDAWKTDFSNHPLQTFIAEFHNSLLNKLDDISVAKSTIDSLRKRITHSIAPILKGSLKHYTGIDIDDFNLDEFLKEYRGKRKSLDDFSETVTILCRAFIEGEKKKLPVFVMVDELDRCRPNYAIELLESIKHLFSSRNLCFIIATDSEQLSKSINAVYGNEFDSARYLHRFFDHEYNLPEPDNNSFSEFVFSSEPIDKTLLFNPTNEPTIEIFAKMATLHKLSIREQKKAYRLLRTMALYGNRTKDIDIVYSLSLIMMKLSEPDDFKKRIADSSKSVKDMYMNGNYAKNMKLQVKERDRGYSTSGEINLIDVIDYYIRYVNINLCDNDDSLYEGEVTDIHSKLKARIREQSPKQYIIGDMRYADIYDYPEQISQIGQIITFDQ